MKLFHVIHACVTGLLVVAVAALGVLAFIGTRELRVHGKGENPAGPAFEQDGRIANKPPGAKARLVVIRGLKTGEEYLIFEGENFVGRTDEKPVEIDLTFQEAPERVWCSRQHAVITCAKGKLIIEDLDSSNGTHVNRKRVLPGKKQELKANDIIQVGEVQLKVQL